LFFALLVPAFAQSEPNPLALTQSDFWLTRNSRGGFDLYIRKRGNIESVLLAGDRLNEGAGGSGLFISQRNNINGGEPVFFPPVNEAEQVYYLIDSTTEYYPPLGAQAFHIYVPAQVSVYSASSSRVVVPVNINEGVTVLVRAFDQTGGNPESNWQDNSFTLRVNIRGWSSGSVDMAHPLSIHFSGSYSAFNPGPGGWLDPNFQLNPAYSIGGGVGFTHHVSNYMGYSVQLERDPVLVNRVILRGIWDWELLGLELGGFLGANNPESGFINPGLSMLFKLKIPQGIFEFTVQIDSSLGRELRDMGDMLQDLYDIHLIAAIPWFLIDASLNSRASTLQPEGISSISNHWTRYQIALTLTGNDWPIQSGLSGGYQNISWFYGHTKYEYTNLYAGFNLKWRILPTFTFTAAADAPLIPFDYLADPKAPTIINLEAGVKWDF
jgi:hypothetical protein